MDKQSYVIFDEKPRLRQPGMVCGIGGWVDGGEAATGSTQYLIKKLKAKKFAEIPLDSFVGAFYANFAVRPDLMGSDESMLDFNRIDNGFTADRVSGAC